MNTPKSTMANGLTGFWMRCDSNLNVRVVNGTMYRLLNAKDACTLTHILSFHMFRQILRQRLYANGNWRKMDMHISKYPRVYGLIGLKAKYGNPGLGRGMTSRKLKALRVHPDMWLNTYSSHQFSLIAGLPDGSASDTVKDFLNRRKNKAAR